MNTEAESTKTSVIYKKNIVSQLVHRNSSANPRKWQELLMFAFWD